MDLEMPGCWHLTGILHLKVRGGLGGRHLELEIHLEHAWNTSACKQQVHDVMHSGMNGTVPCTQCDRFHHLEKHILKSLAVKILAPLKSVLIPKQF